VVHADVDEQEEWRAKMLKQVCQSLCVAQESNGTRPPDDEHACGHKRHNTVPGGWPVHHNLLCNEAKRLRTRAVNAEAEVIPL
jgi:hypothetical protein